MNKQRSYPWRLIALGTVSAALYILIAWQSRAFDYHASTTERPIVWVLVLFAIAFGIYLAGIRLASHSTQSRLSIAVIFGFAVLFRGIMLFSIPIQEIDIYRYLWDGAVATQGVSPFRYSPDQVRQPSDQTADPTLRELGGLRDSQPALGEILSRIHYGGLPTIYPPTSQAVFALSTLTTPDDANVYGRLVIMKAWFVGFDLATLLLVIGLLKLAGKPTFLCIIYGWCPLLMKEVANSGHLDAIAVFLTTLSVYLVVRVYVKMSSKAPFSSFKSTAHLSLAAAVLALAVGAKLYPIILAPLFLFCLLRGIGWRKTLAPAVVFGALTLAVLSPMMPSKGEDHEQPNTAAHGPTAPPSPSESPEIAAVDPSLGVKTFLRYWEINDFVFLILVENLKPTSELPPANRAWFSVVPESARLQTVNRVSHYFGLERYETPFMIARALTLAAFLSVALTIAWRGSRQATPDQPCESCFLTIAWFWLLCPTQNPWYWTWALPLLPFARGRAWLAISGLVFLYYLRFWFSYHWPETPVAGTPYPGVSFFDFVVTWIEFGPWFAWLALAALLRRRNEELETRSE